MKTEGSILIERPIEEVFQITLRSVPEWSQVVIEERLIEDINDGGVGTRFRTVTMSSGQQMEFEGIVTHLDPPYSAASTLTGQNFDIEVAYSFEQVDSQTRVTQWSNVKGKGFFKLILLLMGGLMKRGSCEALQKELNSLKMYCEQVIPQGS